MSRESWVLFVFCLEFESGSLESGSCETVAVVKSVMTTGSCNRVLVVQILGWDPPFAPGGDAASSL